MSSFEISQHLTTTLKESKVSSFENIQKRIFPNNNESSSSNSNSDNTDNESFLPPFHSLIQVSEKNIEKLCSGIVTNPEEYTIDQILFDAMTISSTNSHIDLCQKPNNWYDWFHFTEMKTVVEPDSLEGYLKVNGSNYDKNKRVNRSMMVGRLFQLIHIACEGKQDKLKTLIKKCLQCESDLEVHKKSFMTMEAPKIESCVRMNFIIDHNFLKAILLSVVFNFPAFNCPLLHSTTGLFYSTRIISDLTACDDKAYVCLLSPTYLDRVRIYLSELKPDIGDDWFYPAHKTSGFKKLVFYWPDSKKHFSIQSGSNMISAILSLFKETTLTHEVTSFAIPKCFIYSFGKSHERNSDKSILDHFPKFDNEKIYYRCGFNDLDYILESKFALDAYMSGGEHTLVCYRTDFCHTLRTRKRTRNNSNTVGDNDAVQSDNTIISNSSTTTTIIKSKKQKTK